MRLALLLTVLVLPVFVVSASFGEEFPDAVEGILTELSRADAVLLGERHWSRFDSELRKQLVANPRFAEISGTVLVEFGNSLYQDILDRYLLDLEDVPHQELMLVWRNTRTTTGAWDSPVYEEFYRWVRAVNEDRPRDSRIRVVAAGLPVDWNRVEVWEDLLLFSNRGWWFTRMIEREMASGKIVAIIGSGHFLRKDDEMDEDMNVIRRLEALHPENEFAVILPLVDEAGSANPVADAFPGVDGPVFVEGSRLPFSDWPSGEYFWGATGTLGENADGLIYFGPRDDEKVVIPEGFYEEWPDYVEELERRRALKPRLPNSYN